MKRNNTYKETSPLTSECVDVASAHLNAALSQDLEHREGLRLRLAVEAVLNIWQEKLGAETPCTIWCGSRFGQQSVRLSAPGPCTDPTLCEAEDALGVAGNTILERLGLTPSFRYEKEVNLVTFRLPAKKPNQLVWIGFAAVLAIVLGLASQLLPTGMRMMLTDELATPALGMLLGALSGVAMPMIFFSICISIMNIGDIATLGKIGKKFLTCFLGFTFVASALTIVLVFWLFPISVGSSNGAADFQTILSMLFSMVPTNMVSPFLDGNVLQIIFLSICFGVAFLMLGERARLTGDIIKQLDQAVSLLMAGINRLIPVFVFLTFYTLATSGALSKLGGAVKMVVLVALTLLLMLLVLTVVLSLRMHVPAGILLSKMVPTFLVALSTASSVASYPIRLEACKKRLGVDERTAHFSVPLAQVLFKPSICVLYCCAALCIAEEYGVPITPGWLVLCIVVASILTIAAPPVPGGSKIGYAALLAQLGLPAEGLALVLAAEGVMDFVMTAFNVYVQMVLIVLCGDELGLVDRSILATQD